MLSLDLSLDTAYGFAFSGKAGVLDIMVALAWEYSPCRERSRALLLCRNFVGRSAPRNKSVRLAKSENSRGEAYDDLGLRVHRAGASIVFGGCNVEVSKPAHPLLFRLF